MQNYGSKRLRRQYASLRTFHQVLQFSPNKEGNKQSSSRIGQTLHMLHDKVEYPRSRLTLKKLQKVAVSSGVHIHPPHIPLNLTVICPDWLSGDQADLTSYNVKSLAEHQEETVWVKEYPELVHQARLVMSQVKHQAM